MLDSRSDRIIGLYKKQQCNFSNGLILHDYDNSFVVYKSKAAKTKHKNDTCHIRTRPVPLLNVLPALSGKRSELVELVAFTKQNLHEQVMKDNLGHLSIELFGFRAHTRERVELDQLGFACVIYQCISAYECVTLQRSRIEEGLQCG